MAELKSEIFVQDFSEERFSEITIKSIVREVQEVADQKGGFVKQLISHSSFHEDHTNSFQRGVVIFLIHWFED